MLRLHHAPRSRSSRIVWLLEELKADCQIVYTTITRQDGSGDEDEANPTRRFRLSSTTMC